MGIQEERIGTGKKDRDYANDKVNMLQSTLPFENGQLVVYSCFVPEILVQSSKKLLKWQRRRQEKARTKRLNALVKETLLIMGQELAGERFTYFYSAKEIEYRMSEENRLLQMCDREALTDRLYEILLCHMRKRNKKATLSISLQAECGELTVMRLITIIHPYLSRINAVVFVGEEDAGAQLLEEYLYEEYGIVMRYDKLPEPKTIWIDLQEEQDQNLLKYVKEREICHINRAEVLKFLDTAAKNRYNTKVN